MATVLTPAGCRAGIAAFLKTVPGVGVVHTRRRIVRDENTIRQLFVPKGSAEGKVNVWQIYPAETATTVTIRHPGFQGIGVKGGGQALTTFQWQVDGYATIDDAKGSEEEFFDLAWKIVTELNAIGMLRIDGIVHQLPSDVERFGFVSVGGVALYHYARLLMAFQGKTI